MAGRAATTIIAEGDLALSVCMPPKAPNEGWEWVHLNSIAEMATGHTPSRRHPEYWGGSIKWISVGDARPFHGSVVVQTKESTNQLGIDNSAAVILPIDTVCLSRTASIGYAIRTSEKMATSQGFVNWICGPELLPKFLQYIFVTENSFLKRIATGVAHKTIYYPQVKAFHIQKPPLPEQKRIVAILDEAFGAIAKAKENAERNLANAKELFESYLNKVFTEKGEGWEEKTLADVCEFQNGYAFKSKWYTDTGIRLLRNTNVSHGFVDWSDNVVHLPHDQAEEFCRFKLNKDDIVLSLDRPVISTGLKAAILAKQDLPSLLLQRVLRITSHYIEQEFIFHWLFSNRFLGEIDPGRSLGVPHISAREVGEVSISFPSDRDDQRIIIEGIEKAKTESQRLGKICQQKLTDLDKLKQSILQKAFTGQLTSKSTELQSI